MNIEFTPLRKDHLSLLLKWVEEPHVKRWWDQDMHWTYEVIQEKYGNYISEDSKVHAYIMQYNEKDIGYIQYYNKYAFPPEWNYEPKGLPQSCAGLDWYIGEVEYTGKGIGPKALNMFLDQYVFLEYEYVFTDPEAENLRAIRAYEKVGFKQIHNVNDGETTITWMLKSRPVQSLTLVQTLFDGNSQYP